jgi:hypothetical protein
MMRTDPAVSAARLLGGLMAWQAAWATAMMLAPLQLMRAGLEAPARPPAPAMPAHAMPPPAMPEAPSAAAVAALAPRPSRRRAPPPVAAEDVEDLA